MTLHFSLMKGAESISPSFDSEFPRRIALDNGVHIYRDDANRGLKRLGVVLLSLLLLCLCHEQA